MTDQPCATTIDPLLPPAGDSLVFLLSHLAGKGVECRSVRGHCQSARCRKTESLELFLIRHFAREEEAMRECLYPQFDSHHREHLVLLRLLQSLPAAFCCSHLSDQGFSRLIETLNRHLEDQDGAFRRWLKGSATAHPAGAAA